MEGHYGFTQGRLPCDPDGDPVYAPTAEELREAHAWYEASPPRGVFRQAASELMQLVRDGRGQVAPLGALTALADADFP